MQRRNPTHGRRRSFLESADRREVITPPENIVEENSRDVPTNAGNEPGETETLSMTATNS